MSGYNVKNFLLKGTSQAIGASETDTAVTVPFKISENDSKNTLVKLVASGHSGTVTGKLQDSFDGGTTWEDVASVSITGNGNFEIEHDHSEASTGVMWTLGRVVITTAAASGVTIDKVYVTRRT